MPADADRGYDTNLPELTDFQREVLVSNGTTLPFCLPFSEHKIDVVLPRPSQRRGWTMLATARALGSTGVEAFGYESLPATYSAKLTRLAKL